MKRFPAPAILILAMLLSFGIAACGGSDSSSTSAADKASGNDNGSKESGGNDAVVFTGSSIRVETYCFNGKCNTCNATDKITLSLNNDKVQIFAEGPVMTFPSCTTPSGVSNSEWTLQGSYSAGSNATGSGSFTITDCNGDTITGAKWQGSGSGSIESGNSAKADLQCSGTAEASSKQSDKSEWKGVVLNKQ